MKKYNPTEIEPKWQKIWSQKGTYKVNLDLPAQAGKAKKPFYNLMMFPYPSAEGLHVGNVYAFVGSDIYGRFTRMKGFDVFEPIGLDGFGIHSENYALKVNKHPKDQAKISQENFYRQLHLIGNAFSWDRKVETYDPDYYKWTQWIFIQLFKKGLAYRKKSPVNFCPKDLTVLADEQVIDGKCERCGSMVEKRDLEQWFFKITDYAQRLLDNLATMNWSEKVKIAQKNWIGRSEGMMINFDEIKVFTTRPETVDGATFLVLSLQHPYIQEIKNKVDAKKVQEIEKYIESHSAKASRDKKAKTGVFTGFYVRNTVTGKNIPVWIADYVLMEYGTGAIMAVPAEDERDKEFAKAHKIEIAPTSLKAMPKGQQVVNYHLRDWLISRQRYWGPPIPMINCEKCGWQPVADDQLPVLLPDVKDWKPRSASSGQTKSPLASIESFVNTTCPNCKGPAKRETDVSDTFLDSAWYFFRYISTDNKKNAWTEARVKKWLPVHMYIGGAEHSVLHLLYSRFLTMVFKDLGFTDFEEPFARFYAHGLLIKEGAKMSKSKGNVVVPDEYIRKYGADTLRTYLMFLGPFNQGGDFYDSGIEGVFKFLNRVYKLLSEVKLEEQKSKSSLQMMHKTVKRVTEDMENLRFNTSIAKLMEWYNFLSKQTSISKDEVITFLKLLAPFAPHMTEELYSSFSKDSIHLSSWPVFEAEMLKEEQATIVVQVNGKFRDSITIESSKIGDQKFIEDKAREGRAKNYIKEVKKVIYIEGKILNFVV